MIHTVLSYNVIIKGVVNMAKNITEGQRVALFDMSGVCVGFHNYVPRLKNRCDGFSTIQLAPVVLPLILWDGTEFPVTCDDVSVLDFTY